MRAAMTIGKHPAYPPTATATRWDEQVPCVVGDRPRPSNLTAALRRDVERLVNQQCWCWGCDIRRAEGNLPLAYGFERQRAPEAEGGSSRYRLALDDGWWLCLWGFGVVLGRGDQRGIYLNRYRFQPRLLDAHWLAIAATLHRPDPLEDHVRPLPPRRQHTVRDELARLFNSIGSYEAWVCQQAGVHHRQNCLRQWSRKPATAAGDTAMCWRTLAQWLTSDAMSRPAYENRLGRLFRHGRGRTPAAWQDKPARHSKRPA